MTKKKISNDTVVKQMQINLKIIGNRITRLREARCLCVSELAKELNVKKTILQKIENGTYNFSFDFMLPIANFFGVDAEYFYVVKGNMQSCTH